MMPSYYVTVANKAGDMRRIGPLFSPSASDAEKDAKQEMKRGEKVIDVASVGDKPTVMRKKMEDVDA
jgi:hypothetical protein